MDPDIARVIVAAAVGLSFAFVIYRAARRQILNFQFTLGWLLLSALGVFAGFLAPLLVPIGKRMMLSSSGLLAAGGISLVVVICVQLSINITVLQSQVRTLTEKVAELNLELEQRRDTAD